jgi:hypothetical protein
MVVGAVFLVVASYTMGYTHSSFSFVLVVIGIAILLYGTGTQGMGTLNSDVGAATYKVQLAGGAGVLALCVGLGMVWKSQDIKDAFQIEKKYIRIHIVPASDGISGVFFSNYVAEASFNGEVVPTSRRGHFLEVYPYYFTTERVGTLSVTLYNVQSRPDSLVRQTKTEQFKDIAISRATVKVTDGNLDFPLFQDPTFKFEIDLRSESAKTGSLPDGAVIEDK